MSMHPRSSRTLDMRPVGLFGVCAGLCVAVPALAAGPIGSATSVSQSVTGALSGRPSLVSVGDPVRLHETVRTDASGQARLTLVDDTDVAVLSGSTMTVERYAPGSKLVSAPDGTFQIHTGNGSPGELHVNTSAGTLTPQGTRFWFDVRGGHIKLDVQEGAVRFCPRGKGPAYCVVSTPGHDVIGSAGAPAQVFGMVEQPRSAPTYTAPVRYGENNNTYTNNPYGCRSWGYARRPCASGVSGGGKNNGWDNGGGKSGGVIYGDRSDGNHPRVTDGYPRRIAEQSGHQEFRFRRAPGYGMGGFGVFHH
jgi:FecR protein